MAIGWNGERAGLFETRRHYTNYFKGIPRFKEYRLKMVTSDDAQEVFNVFDNQLEGALPSQLAYNRNLKELMVAEGWSLGGESSGHIICSDVTTTGDGIVAALQVLRAIRDAGETLSTLRAGMTKYPQTMINVRAGAKVDLSAYPDIDALVAAAEQQLGERGRVLLRPSGTEPVVRVMIEGEDATEVKQLCERLAADVERILD